MYKFLVRITMLLCVLSSALVVVVPVSATALSVSPIMADVTCGPNEVHPKDYENDEDKNSCCPKDVGANASAMECFFSKYINPLINLLAALVGIVVTGSLVFAGIQYSSAGGEPNKVSAAKQRIVNSLLALAAFIFLFGFLQWVVPGGVTF